MKKGRFLDFACTFSNPTKRNFKENGTGERMQKETKDEARKGRQRDHIACFGGYVALGVWAAVL